MWVLLVYLTFGEQLVITMDHFETKAQCEAVLKAVSTRDLMVSQKYFDGGYCIEAPIKKG